MEYGFPGEREGETTVQVSNPTTLQISGCRDQKSELFIQVEYLGSADIQRLATEATIE